MSDIEFFSKNKILFKKEDWEKSFDFFVNNQKIKLVGLIRATQKEINENIYKIFENLDSFFCSINGEYFIIIENDKFYQVFLSYSCPRFYISKRKNLLILSQDESRFKNGSFNKNSFIISSLVHHSLLNPLGVFEQINDFLLPGMSIKIDKKSYEYDQNWVLPIEKIGTENDDEKIAKNIAEDFVKELDSYKSLNTNFTLQLSGGVDSALMLAASKVSGLEVKPINFKPSVLPGESREAKKMSNYFGYELDEIELGPNKNSTIFSENTDISDYLYKSEPLLKTGSGMFILNNTSLLGFNKFGYHATLENASYADALSLEHYTKYPYGFFKNSKFNPKHNSELRYFYSKNYIETKLNENNFKDNWGIHEKYPNIHNFYYSFLDPCFFGHIDKGLKKWIVTNNDINFIPILNKVIISRGFMILDKILLSNYFKKNFNQPSVNTVMKLNKILSFINNLSNTASRLFNYRKAKILDQFRPGLNSKILSDLLSVEINDKLVNYPKWHIFRAFEILSKKNFFEINKENSLSFKLINSIKQRIYNKDIRKKQLNNISFNKYLKDRKIFKKYENITRRVGLEKYPNLDFQCKSLEQNFWLVQNILNLSSLENEI